MGKKLFAIVILSALSLTLISFGGNRIYGEGSLSKEAIVAGLLNDIAEKQHNLGKFTVLVASNSTLAGAGQQITSNLQTQFIMDGFKKMDQKFIKADINGYPITETQYNLWMQKRRAKTLSDLLANLPEDNWVNGVFDKISQDFSLEDEEKVDGIPVYKLKVIPFSKNAFTVKESYLYVEKEAFQIVKLIVNGNSNNGEFQVTINYQKVYKNYFVPVLIQVSGQGESTAQQEYKVDTEVTLSNYQSL